MKAIIKNINELSDSKELYETKPNPFFAIFIGLLIGIVVAAIIWMYYGEIDIVSKGRGMIRPNEQLSIIRNKSGGVVNSSNLQEGKQVKAGDVLVTIDCAEQEVKKLQLQEVISEQEKILDNLRTLKKSIESSVNSFNSEHDEAYVQKYIQYEQDFETLKRSQIIDSQNEEIDLKQVNLNKASYTEKIKKAEKDIAGLETLKQSVNEEKSIFKDIDSIYAIEFETYLYDRDALKSKLEEAKTLYNLNVELDEQNLVAKEELKASKQKVGELKNQLDTQKLTLLKEVEEKIEANQTIIDTSTIENNKLIISEELLKNKVAKRKLALEQFKTGELVKLDNQIQELEVQYQSDKRNLEGIQIAIDDCTIRASIDGTLNVVQEINKGDLLTEGTELGKIIPISDSIYKVEVFVPNNDIAGLKVGQEIEYQFDALSYREYGKIKGHITNISTDASQTELGGMSGYWITGSLEDVNLYSYKNEPADLKIGMSCNAYIITEQKKILYYVLEKINLKE